MFPLFKEIFNDAPHLRGGVVRRKKFPQLFLREGYLGGRCFSRLTVIEQTDHPGLRDRTEL